MRSTGTRASGWPARPDTGNFLRRPLRWAQAWENSLRFRLLALGLMPLLVAFPFVIAVLMVVGGNRANHLLEANLRSALAGSRNYLEQLKSDTGLRVAQLVKTDRLVQLVGTRADRRELNQALQTAAESSGLDYLIVASADGRIVGSSTGVPMGRHLPDSHAIRQARIGVASAAYERFSASELASLSSHFEIDARIDAAAASADPALGETRGLLINAAAHFPLSVEASDVVLVGGILLNRNSPLIEHMRQIIFPVGSLPDEAEGLSAIYIDRTSVAASRQRLQGPRAGGTPLPAEVAEAVLIQGRAWLGALEQGGISYMAGLEPLTDGDGRRIGMLLAAFPDGPYQRMTWLLLGMIAALMAMTMLAISFVFLRAGREMNQRLGLIADTMNAVRSGNRQARVGRTQRADELAQLAQHFDELLNTIALQDAAQRDSQQVLADEATRRRALFETERDGVAILNADGTVFEANPKCATMLGYTPEELMRTQIGDWDTKFDPARIRGTLAEVGPEGDFFETLHRRKDGSTYPAEVSVSRAQWGDNTFVFLLMRDITERKAVEAELAQYRRKLETLVDQRTKELQDRTEQLDAIFALSPDGFVSFDDRRRVRFANRAFLQMTGLDGTDLLGLDEAAFTQRLARRGPPGQAFPGVATLRAACRPGIDETSPASPEPAPRQTFQLQGPPARVLEVGMQVSAAAHVSQVLYFRDVTRESEVDRMKSEFLTTAAHELRTPMTSIYGFVNLLRLREMTAQKRGEVLDTISRQSDLMMAIINQLLDLARIEARQGSDFVLERLPLQDIVGASAADYRPPGGRALPVFEDGLPPLLVEVDQQKLQQAVLNLVSNAYKYSPQGGEVRIRYRIDSGEGGLRHGVSVRDHGIGMTPEQLSHVFERFYRADASGNIPGTGLGMSIVQEIVELHRGRVELSSTPGEGTEVTLWLPAA